MATIAQALNLVGLLENELLQRRSDIDKHNDYYRGDQKLKFASQEWRKYHGDRYRDFSDNWVQVVSDSPVERLTVNGVKPMGSDTADDESWRVWQENALDADSQLGFLGAVNSARSFVLVWGDPTDEQTPTVTFEDASQCIVVYEPGSRRERRAALKQWQDGHHDFATLYLPDEVWKFSRPTLAHQDKSPQMQDVDEELKKWEPRDPEQMAEPNPQPNPMGRVPMVELPNRPMLVDEPISDVAGVVAMQDAINLLWAQLFVTGDFASFPQRVILGAEMPTVPVLNEAGEEVSRKPIDLQKFAVDRVQWIEDDGTAKIDQWEAARLDTFTDVIEVAVGHIAAQTRTPQHYLIGKMANLSGDALIAAETGLVKRVEEKQLWFGQALREMFSLVALAQGNESKAQALRAGRVMWADAESRSHAQLADALQKLRQIGFPFEYLAQRYGLTPVEVADVMAMKRREAEMDPVGMLDQMGPPSPASSNGDGPAVEPTGVSE